MRQIFALPAFVLSMLEGKQTSMGDRSRTFQQVPRGYADFFFSQTIRGTSTQVPNRVRNGTSIRRLVMHFDADWLAALPVHTA